MIDGRPLVASNPGSLPTSRQIALALAPEVDAYWTTIAAGRLGRVPGLSRRRVPEALSSSVRTAATPPELLRALAARARMHRLHYRLTWTRNVAADLTVAASLPRNSSVVAHYGAAEATFTRAREGLKVLDYPIARLEAAQELLHEEAARRPDFADTILAPDAFFHAPRHLERMAREVAAADLVVVGSMFVAESFAGVVPPERVAVAGYGCDTTRFRPREGARRPGPLRILFAGQLTQRKGVAEVLDALRLLDPSRFELTLVGRVIGSGRGLAAYSDRFTRLRAVEPAAMPEVFRDADVLVLPSLVEGSAVVVCEALASGLPVVVTPNAGADLVRDGVEGFVVPVRSPETIAERLERLADDELRARMSAAATARRDAADWNRFRGQIRELVGAAPAPMEAAA
jgi:glycosyltransferase involved in cell wall biosynthesis